MKNMERKEVEMPVLCFVVGLRGIFEERLCMIEYLVWALTGVLVLVGIAGVVVPLLPGTTLVWVAMILHKILLPDSISWGMLGWVTVWWVLSVLVDFLGTALGAKLFGGTKWGMAGATGGALVGMFFSLPALLLGTVFGAVAAEKFIAKQSGMSAVKTGIGAAVGFLISTVGRLICVAAMVWVFLVGVC